jgi:hypothetical protein
VSDLLFLFVVLVVVVAVSAALALVLGPLQLLLVLLLPLLFDEAQQLVPLHLGQRVVRQQELAVDVVELVAAVLSRIFSGEKLENCNFKCLLSKS